MKNNLPTIAILGGTGDLGSGLALRWLTAGYKVVIGSRTIDKANDAVETLNEILHQRGIESPAVSAMDNSNAAQVADIVALTVPFSHQASTLEQVKDKLKDKILIDVTVPLVPPKVMRVQLPSQGSAGQIAQEICGEDVQVISAFQNVPAVHLKADGPMACDVLVCGNNKTARAQVCTLVEAAGMRGIQAGSIANAAAAEALTSLLIFINKQNDCHAGIKITGLQEHEV